MLSRDKHDKMIQTHNIVVVGGRIGVVTKTNRGKVTAYVVDSGTSRQVYCNDYECEVIHKKEHWLEKYIMNRPKNKWGGLYDERFC